jgi:cytochrome c oxidase assembly protein subunit 15
MALPRLPSLPSLPLRPSLTPHAYARTTGLALAALAVIVVTGGAVRVTGSGLGCPDWPTCAAGHVVAPLSYHPMVEFLNRVVTGLVSVVVIVAVLGSLARVPRRADLTWLSVGLVVGVVGQIFLGGLVVRYHLWPPLVMGHFAVSMALVADAVVLRERASWPDGAMVRRAVADGDHRLGRLLVAATALALALGTVVTGSGPHAGSHDGQLVERLPFELRDVARLHGTAVMIVVGMCVVLWRSLRASGAAGVVVRRADALLAVLVAQALVGYVQYFTGVPAVLVAVHIAGATAVWVCALRLLLSMRVPSSVPVSALAPAV